ncbi:peptide chain release factor 1-like, mitochondrial [Anneissia japonica]|uniref:peptide chain release factor 1-like, mitochondrial n=1 Tax=Anneissia japonica TaxID=1529436 RepID=UPI00142555AB|nr:peptide chain release factor 1-like, mitochondrial [Anneissia japonica]XP_033118001.1 peptide chain release factor 1-like, mitochondrial [Anneissia japonica]
MYSCLGTMLKCCVLHQLCQNSKSSALASICNSHSRNILTKYCHHTTRKFHLEMLIQDTECSKPQFPFTCRPSVKLPACSVHVTQQASNQFCATFPAMLWTSSRPLLNHLTRKHCIVRHLSSSHATSEEDPLSPSSHQFQFYLEELLQEFDEISSRLGLGIGDDMQQKKIVKRRQELGPVVEKINEIHEKKEELNEVKLLLKDNDAEMKRLAELEKEKCLDALELLEDELLSILKPTTEIDDNDVVVELTAGVGGQEAMLFTTDIFDMYQNYAKYKRWKFTELVYNTSDLGGVRHATMSMQGPDVYKLMKYEGGVHRVQRIPKTEKAGRVHTSTMTVAVLPQPKEIDLQLDPKDLRIETKKASGAGGQHVNTTDSAVRILHIPTGISAESQQERSQHKNRHIAMTMLHARIYKKQLEEQNSQERMLRSQQVGTSGRSEKIRTYNFNQDRVTDHRISMNTFDVEGFLGGGELLDDLISKLCYQDDMDTLRNTIEKVFRDHHET